MSTLLSPNFTPEREQTPIIQKEVWLANFRLSLDQSQSATFNFTFHWKTADVAEVSLQIRVEAQKQVVLLGLPKDF